MEFEGGYLWLHNHSYLIPAANTYPRSSAPSIYLDVSGYTIGVPSDLYILTTNRGYVIAGGLTQGDVLMLALQPVSGSHSDAARPPFGSGIVYQVTQRILALRVEGAAIDKAMMPPPLNGSYVTWTPTGNEEPPNTDSTPIDQIACLCLLPGVLVRCPDVVDLTDEVEWTEET